MAIQFIDFVNSETVSMYIICDYLGSEFKNAMIDGFDTIITPIPKCSFIVVSRARI